MKEHEPSCFTRGTWKIEALSYRELDRREERISLQTLNKIETSVFIICASLRFTNLKICKQNICEADKEDYKTSKEIANINI